VASRYTRKNREQAALICAIAASTPDCDQSYGEIGNRLGIIRADDEPCASWAAAMDLALHAWGRCISTEHPNAEAEALIRSGWREEASDE